MMKFFRRRWCAIVLSALAGVLALPGDHAARSQTATIKIVVPYPPGGGIDATARLFAEHIGKGQGPKMIIENRPGAASIIGTESVDHAPADGSTVLFATNTLVVLPQLRTLSYDPRTAFGAICSVASTPIVVVVSSASPYRTLNDLIGDARKNPGALTLAVVPAGVLHVAYEMLAAAANINMTLVPFTGTVAEITSVLGGHVTATLADYPSAAPQIQAANSGHWLSAQRAASIGSRASPPSPSPVIRHMQPISGMASSRRRRRQRKACATCRLVCRCEPRPGNQGKALLAGALSDDALQRPIRRFYSHAIG